jgi:hypothetical protein
VAASGAVAALGAIAFGFANTDRTGVGLASAGSLTAALVALAVATPGFLELRLSPYKALSATLRFPGAEVVATDWGLAARVDWVRSDGIRSLPGLSYAYSGVPPPQQGLAFDGDDVSPVPLVSPDEAEFVGHLLGSLPYELLPEADVLVLDPRGGLNVLTALAAGAAMVTAVEPHGAAVAAVEAAGTLYDDERVTVEVAEPRSFVERTGRRFDVVDLALSTSYRPVFSGAYSLAEDYRLTLEAFDAYLDRLRPGGALVVARWVQTPPSEAMRVVALAAEASRRRGVDPVDTVVAVRGYSVALVLVRPDGFDTDDLTTIASFANEHRFDVFAAPGLQADGANRFNVVPTDDYFPLAAALLSEDPATAYRRAEFDITPPTDDHPFFGHFFTWDQASVVLEGLGKSWQPFGGAGYFVLVALLGLSILGAVALIAGPLMVTRIGRRPGRKGMRRWTLAYFGLLGSGFLFVEIPLIQRFILVVGSPTAALAVVLFALLVASGAGSLASPRLPWRTSATVVTGLIVVYPFVLESLDDVVLQAPSGLRMAAGAALLAPLGFLMGMMFPRGIAHLEERAPRLVPWAWGVNGTMSVISAAASALLALTFGFRWVIWAGALCYGLCIPLTDRG